MYFRTFHAGYARRHVWLTLLVVLGVAIGVAAVVAIESANAAAIDSFRRALDVVTGKATHVVTAGYPGVPDELWPKVRLDPAVVEAAPVVEARLLVTDPVLPPLRLEGIDLFSAASFLPGATSPMQGDAARWLASRTASCCRSRWRVRTVSRSAHACAAW